MAFIEKSGFIHRDLRTVNVFVGEQNGVKVGDFGLSRQLARNEEHSTLVEYITHDASFPYRWTAPECFQYGEDCFIFSIKVIAQQSISFAQYN